MSKMRIVPERDMEVLREYLGDPMVFLVPEAALAGMSSETVERLRAEDGSDDVLWSTDEADTWLTFVTTEEDIANYREIYADTWENIVNPSLI